MTVLMHNVSDDIAGVVCFFTRLLCLHLADVLGLR